jgi:hypothetical protein
MTNPPRWLAPLLATVLVAFGAWSLEPPAVLASGARAWATAQRLLDGVGPHPVGTPPAREVERRLVAELEALGFTPTVEEHTFCGYECLTVRNVLVALPGSDPDRWVGLSSHYDSVWAGPGAGDDMAGTAAAVEILRTLRDRPHRAGVIALFNEGEEANLYGAKAFVQTDWADRLLAIVNLEARGTSGPAYLFEINAPMADVGRAYGRFARRPAVSGLYAAIYAMLPNNTDVAVYDDARIPAANIAFLGHGERYHTPFDDLDHLDPRTLQHVIDQGLAMVLAFSETDADWTATAPALLFDVAGWWVVCLPFPAAHGIVALGLVLAAWRVRPTLRATVVPLGVAGLLVLVASACDTVIHALGGGFGWPSLALTGLWGLAALGVVVCRRLCPTPDLVHGIAAVQGVLAVVVSAVLPEGAYLVGPGLVLLATVGVHPRYGPLGALAGAWMAVLAVGLPDALGISGPVVVVPAFLALLPIAPFVHVGSIGRPLGVVTLVAGLGCIFTPVQPTTAVVERVVTAERGWAFQQASAFPRPGRLPPADAAPDAPPLSLGPRATADTSAGFVPADIDWTGDRIAVRSPGGWAMVATTSVGAVLTIEDARTDGGGWTTWLGDTTDLTLTVSPETTEVQIAIARPTPLDDGLAPIHTGHRTWSHHVIRRP